MTGGIIPTPRKRPREVLPPSDLSLANQAGRADALKGLPQRLSYREFPLLLAAYRMGYQRGKLERAAAAKGQIGC